MNEIYLEDCKQTLEIRDFRPDYVFMGPPDFSEIGLNPSKDRHVYESFLNNIFTKISMVCGVVTVALTDRKCDGFIMPKHYYIMKHFLDRLNWNLVSHKIWVKSDKINLYRLNYSNIMTFARHKPKQNQTRAYMYDTFSFPDDKYSGYTFGMPCKIVQTYIENFTKEGNLVYDPFMGSGTTAVACIFSKRNYVGSEISKETHALALQRIAEINSSFKF